jgi:hypothetical protein
MPIQLSGSLAITGSMVATGQITAQTLVVQTITSSIDFVTGSTRFGSLLTNTHQFTGSVSMIDSLNVNGTIRATNIIYANNTQGVVFNTASVGDVRLKGDNAGGGLDGGDYILKTGVAYYGDVVTDNYLTYGTLTGSFGLLGAGIGAGTPQATLDVSGSTKIRGIAQVTGSLIVSGSSTLINIGPAIFTGSVNITGSLSTVGSVSMTGSLVTRGLFVTGSDANINAVRVGRGFSTSFTNIAIGTLAISGPTFANVTGTNNIAIGYQALTQLRTGNDNTAVGYQALLSGSIGLENTAIGSQALSANVSGSYNTAVGALALTTNTTGDNNVAVGVSALRNNSTGTQNIAVGALALTTNTTGDNNTALGVSALISNTTGYSNTALGVQSLNDNTTGFLNVAIGASSLLNNTEGYDNTAVGYNTGRYITTGQRNTIIGNNNNLKPDNLSITTENDILSIASSGNPEIWAQKATTSVDDNGASATILSIDPTIYAGAVVDYSLQDSNGAQRTSTMLIAFDCNANVTYTDPNPIEQGSTADYTFIPTSNAPLIDLVLTNNFTAPLERRFCAVAISCRLLKRFYAC